MITIRRTVCCAGTAEIPKGFSLLEMMIVIAISLTLAGITAIAYMPVVKQQHMVTAYNATLTTLRRARDQAAGDMRIYVVTFSSPGTITVQQSGPGNATCTFSPTGSILVTTVLPPDVSFSTQIGFPSSSSYSAPPTTPDGFGTGAYAVDLDQANNNPNVASVCFNPDGTATDQSGNVAGGVVYLSRANDLYSARAITLWGATGRIRGWRLYNAGGNNTWSQQ
jgi:prepilin-type N-terminal cleavage/methylation domain-containing protein